VGAAGGMAYQARVACCPNPPTPALASSTLGPVTTKVELTDAEAEGVIYGDAVDSLLAVDWATLNENRAAWTDRWNREIER